MSKMRLLDMALVPFVWLAAWLMREIRRVGIYRFPLCKRVLFKVGVFPIRNHYYEPQFDYTESKSDFSQDRDLLGIDWNVPGQLKMLERLTFSQELLDLPKERQGPGEFYLNNKAFESGDAEYWYQVIRSMKPKRIIEIGSGDSTLMAVKAVNKNREEDPGYACEHTCIEPYERPWLEKVVARVIRKRVEDVELSFFSQLEENDILFIDSSHIIRPEGDVLFEYLHILPSLRKGVIVHVHDIFSPKNYQKRWLADHVKFWNEQYLLEAFLTHNSSWEILGALNFLCRHHYDELKAAAPFLLPERQPGSFYIQKVA